MIIEIFNIRYEEEKKEEYKQSIIEWFLWYRAFIRKDIKISYNQFKIEFIDLQVFRAPKKLIK